MTAKVRRREKLGRWSGLFGGRQVVYVADDGIEVDELDGYEVTRRRVFWEDVLLVTYHRHIGVAFPLVTAVAAALFGLMAIGVGSGDATAGVIVAVIFCLPFVVVFALRLALGVDVVTVFGRRTMARMRFSYLKARARRTFGMIVDRARRAQDQIARKYAEEDAARPAPAPEAAPADGVPPPLAVGTGAFAPPAPPGPPAPPPASPRVDAPPGPPAAPGVPADGNAVDDRDAATGGFTKRESVSEQDGPAPAQGAFEPPPVDDSNTGPSAPGAGPA
ncbi:MAG: hypothetical protein ACYS9X_00040 [Planctomycetota bacterium]|jgi:hypothetical protein